MSSVKILGTGRYAPSFEVSNDDFAKFLDTSDEWITTRTGMKTRHIATNEPTWYLGEMAAKSAMENACLAPDDIDMVIVTTVSSDFYIPSLACILQYRLGIKNAFSFDVNVACTGMAFAIDMAKRYLADESYKKILIVCAESLSQTVDYTDRSSCVLFGDGAGACIIESAEGLYGSHMMTDTEGTPYIYHKRPRKETPFGGDCKIAEPFEMLVSPSLTMLGRDVYKYSTRAVPPAIEKACEKAGINVGELDMIIPHQANYRILQTIAKNMNLPIEKFAVNIQDYGNTSSGTIAICLDEYIKAGKISRGDKICIVGFGAGFNCAATVFEY